MKESYGEGLATHTGPESCGAAREGGVEALTGVRAGRVLSRESNLLRDADAVEESGRLHPVHRYREVPWSPARSETPSTHGNTSRENREIPCSPEANGVSGRVGKSKDVRRR
jgi:RNA-directed DNA polymerase